MEFTMDQYRESADFLRDQLKGFTPKIAMVLGSGLGGLGDEVEPTSRPPPPPATRAGWCSAPWRGRTWP